MKRNTKKASYREDKIKRYRAFGHRLRFICDLMVGPGYYEMIPIHALRVMFSLRYPPVTIIIDENGKTIISGAEIKHYHTTLAALSKHFHIQTLLGGKILISMFLTDTLLLIHYIQYRIAGKFRTAATLLSIFEPYFTHSVWYEESKRTVSHLIGALDAIFYDLKKGMVRSNTENLALSSPWAKNTLKIYKLTLQTVAHEIEGKKRNLIKLGENTAEALEPKWIMLLPHQLGFTHIHLDFAMPLYIQHHAIIRFEERTSLCSGCIPAYLADIFKEGRAKVYTNKYRCLLEYSLDSHKIGYFVITFNEDKWVVRTFLFLTNESTPEGKLLARLTNLTATDRQFLTIDRLSAFFKYDIGNNRDLLELFTKSGCSSLIDFASEYRSMEGSNPVSPDTIFKYLLKV